VRNEALPRKQDHQASEAEINESRSQEMSRDVLAGPPTSRRRKWYEGILHTVAKSKPLNYLSWSWLASRGLS
jgi:hypothetical protein